MDEILAYVKNIIDIEKETYNNKIWISSDSPTQEKFENLCFVAVDTSYGCLFTAH